MKKIILLLLVIIVASIFVQAQIPSSVNCPMCQGGAIRMPCKSCHGTRTIIVRGFNGYPMQRTCYTCGGSGFGRCNYCGGSGSIRNPIAGYPVKDVLVGGIRCIQCYGTGKWICPLCLGITPKVYSCSYCNAGVSSCSICGGSGTFFGTNNYGGGYSSGNSNYNSERRNNTNTTTREKKDCPSCYGGKCTYVHSYGVVSSKLYCNGTGQCGWCDGRGYIYVGTRTQTCSACGGNKKCKTCHGSGKCSSCGGTGYR